MEDESGPLFRYSGALVALVGFGITRLLVVDAVRTEAALSFLLAGLVPLVVGLGLTVFGVALAVGAFSRDYARTVARWCLAGTLAMGLVVLVTALDPFLRGMAMTRAVPRALVGNVLLGGAVGGVLIGDRSATNRRQRREIRRQANRGTLLTRLLRHEVINAVTIIGGHVDLLTDTDDTQESSVEAVGRATRRIESAVETVETLAHGPDELEQVDLTAAVEDEVAAVRDQFPGVTVALDAPERVRCAADDRLRLVVGELLSNAAEPYDSSRVEVEVGTTSTEAAVTVRDDGHGMSAEYQELLTARAFPEYDDPSSGFGLQIVRMLVTRYDGRIHVDDGIDGAGTAVTVALPRTDARREPTRAVEVTFPNLYRGVVAGVVAGVSMGGFYAITTDTIPVIGALYGVSDPVIGWVAHLFHSVVFALLFVAGRSYVSARRQVRGAFESVVVGMTWGVALWLVAAGVVMPLWLRAVGVASSFPELPPVGLVAHLLWGGVLGGTHVALRRLGFGTDR
jgi:two-component system OmpR family sensor kinase